MHLRSICAALAAFCFVFVTAQLESDEPYSSLNSDHYVERKQWLLLANSKICVKLECEKHDKEALEISVRWTLTRHTCWFHSNTLQGELVATETQLATDIESELKSLQIEVECAGSILLPPLENSDAADAQAINKAPAAPKLKQPPFTKGSCNPIVTVGVDGIYELSIYVKPKRDNANFSKHFFFETRGPHGYISAVDWPLLPFYGIMCVVYVIFGIIWLVFSFTQWRDLLRIQFWIGGVILLGMLEKAFFYEQYQSLNHTGTSALGAELTAEFVSCAKRTLARMLVIIMSLGFGIVKPRLGPMLHRVVGVGTLYFVLACVESYLRVMRSKTDERNELMVASIPLAVLDTGICWWIFTSLVQTTRTLRLRRNMVKLELYRHFTNTLIFAVIASVIFMLCAMQLRKNENCTPGWHYIWIDTAFWHILFSVLLLVIMILWRPTNNNQRYAFTPMLDNSEDEDEEDEEDQFVSDAYGVKMRNNHLNGSTKSTTSLLRGATTTEEDDLRWVEENIPSSMADSALPVLDSDEEIISTKFEVSKMQ